MIHIEENLLRVTRLIYLWRSFITYHRLQWCIFVEVEDRSFYNWSKYSGKVWPFDNSSCSGDTNDFDKHLTGPWVVLLINRHFTLQWRHDERDGVSNQQHRDCLLNRLGADQRKHQSYASLAFVRGIHRLPVNYPHKGQSTRKIFPFDDVIMSLGSYPMKQYR